MEILGTIGTIIGGIFIFAFVGFGAQWRQGLLSIIVIPLFLGMILAVIAGVLWIMWIISTFSPILAGLFLGCCIWRGWEYLVGFVVEVFLGK